MGPQTSSNVHTERDSVGTHIAESREGTTAARTSSQRLPGLASLVATAPLFLSGFSGAGVVSPKGAQPEPPLPTLPTGQHSTGPSSTASFAAAELQPAPAGDDIPVEPSVIIPPALTPDQLLSNLGESLRQIVGADGSSFVVQIRDNPNLSTPLQRIVVLPDGWKSKPRASSDKAVFAPVLDEIEAFRAQHGIHEGALHAVYFDSTGQLHLSTDFAFSLSLKKSSREDLLHEIRKRQSELRWPQSTKLISVGEELRGRENANRREQILGAAAMLAAIPVGYTPYTAIVNSKTW
jgi:hypothetical protein